MSAEGASRPLSVLVAAADTDARTSCCALLGLWGHDVCTAADGSEAVVAACVFSPDVCLLDIDMPVMDGYAAARAIRELPGLGGAVLVAVSGGVRPGDAERECVAGFHRRLTKPVRAEQLERLLAGCRTAGPACWPMG
jgi:CheY-like chemotaxis protein